MTKFRKSMILGAAALALAGFGVSVARAQTTSNLPNLLNIQPADITPAANSAPPLGVVSATPTAPAPIFFFN